MKSKADFKTIDFALTPTPLCHLKNASKELGINLYIKRDDMTGVSLGGNKVRKLEFLLADAVEKGCDTVITTGGAQSNHAQLTAACCKRVGLNPILVLKQRGVMGKKGNLLLDDLMGVDVRFVDTDKYDDVYVEMDKLKVQLENEGHKVYVVPVGGSVPLGSLGYVECAREMFVQAKEMGVKFDHVIGCAGSGGTLAGIVLGTKIYGDDVPVTGIAVCDDPFEEITAELVNESAKLLDAPIHVSEKDIDVRRYYGAGYAIPSPEGVEAIKFMARNEGIMLDPVYTGKTFAGLIDMVHKNIIKQGENVLFLHTGGAASLFAIDIDDVK